MYNPSNSNRVEELEAFAVSYTHAHRDSSNNMHLVEVFKTLGGEDCMDAAMTALIKRANKSNFTVV